MSSSGQRVGMGMQCPPRARTCGMPPKPSRHVLDLSSPAVNEGQHLVKLGCEQVERRDDRTVRPQLVPAAEEGTGKRVSARENECGSRALLLARRTGGRTAS